MLFFHCASKLYFHRLVTISGMADAKARRKIKIHTKKSWERISSSFPAS
jgi:hypothetical protein